jgi:oligopeptide transport system substrate-binding protein
VKFCEGDYRVIFDLPAKLRRSLFAAIYLGLAVPLSACTQSSNKSTEASTAITLRRGLGGEPASLDPAAAPDTFSTQVLEDLFEGLTSTSPTGEVLPGVASSWSLDSTGKEYTFQLRSGARWSNGKPVRAQEFVTAWRRVLDPKQSSPVSNDLRIIAGATAIIAGRSPPESLGVTAQQDDVLVVKLEQPAPYFLQLLTHPAAFPIYSDSSVRSHDPNQWVSDGPYVLANWQPGTKLELIRNGAYWDHASVHIPRIQYLFFPDQNSQFAAYRAGQLDMTDTVPVNAIGSLRSEHPKEILIAPYLGVSYYGFNVTAHPFKGNTRLRKSLAMAIDRKLLVASLALGQATAYSFVPPGTWNYEPQPTEWAMLSDVDRLTEAKRLYMEAGYSKQTPLRLRLLFNSNPAIKQAAIMIAAMWKEELGIETELIDEEFRVFLQSRHEKEKWEIVRLAWSADYNDASSFLDVFRTNSSSNDTGYSNPIFDRILDEASDSVNPETRRGLLENAERIMLADYPAIPLYFYVSKRLVKPYIFGVKPNPLDRVGSKNLEIVSTGVSSH